MLILCYVGRMLFGIEFSNYQSPIHFGLIFSFLLNSRDISLLLTTVTVLTIYKKKKSLIFCAPFIYCLFIGQYVHILSIGTLFLYSCQNFLYVYYVCIKCFLCVLMSLSCLSFCLFSVSASLEILTLILELI